MMPVNTIIKATMVGLLALATSTTIVAQNNAAQPANGAAMNPTSAAPAAAPAPASTTPVAPADATTAPATSQAAPDAMAAGMEKCYGVAKAGKNDCQTSTHSCAGSVAQDRQADAFLVVPKGLCDKIAGGTTGSIQSSQLNNRNKPISRLQTSQANTRTKPETSKRT